MEGVKKAPLKKKSDDKGTALTLSKIVGHSVCGNGMIGVTGDTHLAYSVGAVIVVHDWRKDSNVVLIKTKKVVGCIATHPTMANVLAASENGGIPRVVIWDIKTQQPILTIRKHKKQITSLMFSACGNVLVSCGSDEVFVWNWKSQFASPLAEYQLPARFCTLRPMNSLGFVTCGSSGHLQAWPYSPKDRERIPKFNLKGFSSANFIAVGCIANSTYVVAEASPVIELDKKGNAAKWVHGLTGVDRQQDVVVTAACVSDQYIAVGASDGKVNIFATQTLAFVTKVPAPSTPSPLTALVFDHRYLHLVNMEKSTYHYELQQNEGKVGAVFLASRSMHGTAIWGMQPIYSNGGSTIRLASCSEEGKIQLWTVAGDDGNKVRSYQMKGTEPRSLAVNCDGTMMAVGDKQGNVTLMNITPSGITPGASSVAHESDVVTLAFGPSCAPDLLGSGGRDGMVHLLRAAQGELQVLLSFNPHSHAITSICLQPSKESSSKLLLITTSTDGNIVYQPLSTEGEVTDEPTVFATKSPILSAAMHPKGTFLLTVGKNDFLSCRQMAVPVGQARRQYSIPSDGKGHHMVKIEESANWVAVAGCNGSIKIADYYSGTIVAQTPNTGTQPTVMAWVAHGNRLQLLVGDAEGCLYVWKFSGTTAMKMVSDTNRAGAKPPAPAPSRPAVQEQPKPPANVHKDPKGPLFTSGVLRNNVEGKWHGQAYQAFVKDALDFPQFDAMSTASSRPMEDDSDDDVIPLSKQSVTAANDIESLWGNTDNSGNKIKGSPLRMSITSQWKMNNQRTDPHPSVAHYDPQLPTDAHPSVSAEAHVDPTALKMEDLGTEPLDKIDAFDQALTEHRIKSDAEREAKKQEEEHEKRRSEAEEKVRLERKLAEDQRLKDEEEKQRADEEKRKQEELVKKEEQQREQARLASEAEDARKKEVEAERRREEERKAEAERKQQLETKQQEELRKQQEEAKLEEQRQEAARREEERLEAERQEAKHQVDKRLQEEMQSEEVARREELQQLVGQQVNDLKQQEEAERQEAAVEVQTRLEEEARREEERKQEELRKAEEAKLEKERHEEEARRERARLEELKREEEAKREREKQERAQAEEARKQEERAGLQKKFDEVKQMQADSEKKKADAERKEREERERQAMEVINKIEEGTPTGSDTRDTEEEELTKSVVKQRLQEERDTWRRNKSASASQLDASTASLKLEETRSDLNDTRSSFSRSIVYPQSCRKGLDKMVEGMQQVFESISVEPEPNTSVSSLVTTATEPPPRATPPDEDFVSVLHWMKANIDGLLQTTEAPSSPTPSSPQVGDPALESRLATLESELTQRLTKRWENEMNDIKKLVIQQGQESPK